MRKIDEFIPDIWFVGWAIVLFALWHIEKIPFETTAVNLLFILVCYHCANYIRTRKSNKND